MARTPLVLRLEYDPDAESPCEWDCSWRLWSFCRRHSNFKHPMDLGILPDGRCSNPGLRRKLEVGLAWLLSYYEHGQCSWMLQHSSEWMACPDKVWDGVALAGILVWEHKPSMLGAKTEEERREAAKRFLEIYNNWANGAVYSFDFPDSDLMGCCGFYTQEDVIDAVKDTIDFAEYEIVEVTGSAAWIAEDVDWDEVTQDVCAEC